MRDNFPSRRPAISGIESAVFGVIGLAGLASILFAATPIFDMAEGGNPGAAVSYRSNAVPATADVVSSAARSGAALYPRAI